MHPELCRVVLLQEKAQIRREERAKRQQRMEDINTLKSMGYSERAAQVALRYTQGNLDQAFKVPDFQYKKLICCFIVELIFVFCSLLVHRYHFQTELPLPDSKTYIT